MTLPICKLSLVTIAILVYHHAMAHLVLFELPVKRPSIVKPILSFHLLIILPFTPELITVDISIHPETLPFAIVYMAFIKLIFKEFYLSRPKHDVLLELSIIFSLVLPFVCPQTLLLAVVEISFIIMPIRIVDFALAFDMVCDPIGLNSSLVGEYDKPETFLITMCEVSFVYCTILIIVCSFPISFAIDPHAIVDLAIRIGHFPPTFFQVVFPITLIDVSIGVVIPSPALLSILDDTFIAIPILEYVNAVNKYIFLPISEVKVSIIAVMVHAVTIPLYDWTGLFLHSIHCHLGMAF